MGGIDGLLYLFQQQLLRSSNAVNLFEHHPNLWADLSAGSGLTAMRRDSEHAVTFITRYQDRLLYGRDAPGNDLQEFLVGLDMSKSVREKVMSENALRLIPRES